MSSRTILTARAEILRLRGTIEQKYCARCAKKLPKTSREMRFRSKEIFATRPKRIANGRIVDEDVCSVVSEYIGDVIVPAKHKYAPFCTARCAIAFAQSAHLAGYRTVRSQP